MAGSGCISGLVLTLLLSQLALAEGMPDLHRGDVVFQTSRSGQSTAILEATGSPFSHVGIVDFDDSGASVVLEAAQTTQATPLADWIARGVGGHVAVYRLEGLEADQAPAVTRAARTHLGKGYDPYFNQSEDRLYCSELIHIAFRDGAGLGLGAVETLADLNLDTAAARALIADRWQSHPTCADGKAGDADSCLAMIRDEPLVTPQSVADDPRLRLLWSSFDD